MFDVKKLSFKKKKKRFTQCHDKHFSFSPIALSVGKVREKCC